MSTRRMILIGVILVSIITILSIFLGSKLSLLLLSGLLFYTAYRFSGQLWIQRFLVVGGSFLFLMWIGAKFNFSIEGFKTIWLSIFNIPFNYIAIFILLAIIWLWKKKGGMLARTIVFAISLILLAAWVGGNGRFIFDGLKGFTNSIPEDSFFFISPETKEKTEKIKNGLLDKAIKATDPNPAPGGVSQWDNPNLGINLFDKIVIDSDFPKCTGKIYPPGNYILEANPPSSVYLRIRAAGSDEEGEFRPPDSDGKISIEKKEEGFAMKATSDTIVYVYN